MFRSNHKRTAGLLWTLAVATSLVHAAFGLFGMSFIQGVGPKLRTEKSTTDRVPVQLSCTNEGDMAAKDGSEPINRLGKTVGMVFGSGIAAGLAVACASAAAPEVEVKKKQYRFEGGSGQQWGAVLGLVGVGGGVGAFASMQGSGPQLSIGNFGGAMPSFPSFPPPPSPPPSKPEAAAKKKAPSPEAEKAEPPPKPAVQEPAIPPPTIELKGKDENFGNAPQKEVGGKKWTML